MSNDAAIGYMILAAQKLGMDPEQIRKLDSMMYAMMDMKTEDEAEEAYRNN